MSPRPDVSEERKGQILEAALVVFARLGFHESRMDDIASQAGLSKAALYLYYKSKDAIIAALLKHFFTQAFTQFQGVIEANQEKTAAEQLLLLTRQLTEALQWMTQVMPIAFEFYALAGRDQEVRQFLKSYFQDYRALLAGLIRRGIEQGEFREVSPEATAIMLTALFEGLALLFFLDAEAVHWADEAEASVRLLLAGLKR